MDELSQYRDDIHEQASDWFALIYIGDPSKTEREAFNVWCESHPSHRQAYQALILVWEGMTLVTTNDDTHIDRAAAIAEKPAQVYTEPNHKPLQYAANRSDHNRNHNHNRTPNRRGIIQAMVGIAACALVVCSYVLTSGALLSNREAPHILQTAVGETSQFTLPDGSHINLSGNSRIEYRTGKIRQVTLTQGQAYFSVVSKYNDEQHKIPFEVITPDFSIAVVGTAFDVNTHSIGTTIEVTEGEVQVTLNQQQATLVAGQRVATERYERSRLTPIASIAQDTIGSWRHGRLVYMDTPLSVVLDDARRFYSGSIVLADPELAELRVTATFRTHQIHAMTQMLEQLLPIKVYSQNNGQKITLVKRR